MVTITNLARSIDLIARRCPRGLSALAGDAPQPSHDELVAAATWTPAATKLANSDASMRFSDPLIHIAIERCGGWTTFYFLTQAEKREQFLPAYAEAFRKRVDIGNAPDHAAGDWEKRGGYLHPWTPEKIIDVDAELAKREEQKRLTA